MKGEIEAERKVTKWEPVKVLKCHFCGDVYEPTSGKLNKLISHDDHYLACDFCLQTDKEPRFPDDVRPSDS